MDELDEFMGTVSTQYLSRHMKRYIDKQVSISCVPFPDEPRYVRFLEWQLIRLKRIHEDDYFELLSIWVDDEMDGAPINHQYPAYIKYQIRNHQGIVDCQQGWHGDDILDPDAEDTIEQCGALIRRT